MKHTKSIKRKGGVCIMTTTHFVQFCGYVQGLKPLDVPLSQFGEKYSISSARKDLDTERSVCEQRGVRIWTDQRPNTLYVRFPKSYLKTSSDMAGCRTGPDDVREIVSHQNKRHCAYSPIVSCSDRGDGRAQARSDHSDARDAAL